MGEEILVSVVCITYNHEKYIRDALEGILAQDTDYKYEIIVHDDASLDNTSQIIREYEEKYPHIFRCIYQSSNQYSVRGASVLRDVMQLCRGKYIALCEGDDFWIDRHKLQIQVQWMEDHPDYYMVAHNAIQLDCRDGSLRTRNSYGSDCEITPEEIIMQYCDNLPSASLVVRSDIRNMEPFFWESGVGDFPIQLYSVFHGKIFYWDRIMSVYRYQHKGSWCKDVLEDSKTFFIHYVKMIRFCKQYSNYTNGRYDEWMEQVKYRYLFYMVEKCKSLPYDNYRKMAEIIDAEIEPSLCGYWMRVKEILDFIRDESCLDEETSKFIIDKKSVYIWGTGYYADLLAKKLERKDLSFNGFLISDGQPKLESYNGKKVQWLSELCTERKRETDNGDKMWGDVNIVVAVNPAAWREIRSTLGAMNVTNLKYIFYI